MNNTTLNMSMGMEPLHNVSVSGYIGELFSQMPADNMNVVFLHLDSHTEINCEELSLSKEVITDAKDGGCPVFEQYIQVENSEYEDESSTEVHLKSEDESSTEVYLNSEDEKSSGTEYSLQSSPMLTDDISYVELTNSDVEGMMYEDNNDLDLEASSDVVNVPVINLVEQDYTSEMSNYYSDEMSDTYPFSDSCLESASLEVAYV